MKLIMEYKWSFLALAGILCGLFLSRGGVGTLLPLIRFLMPVIVVLVALNFLQKKVKNVATNFVAKNMGQAPGRPDANVIDLCPKCGSYMKAGHKC